MSAAPQAVTILLATRSLGKLYELRPLFAAAGIEVADLRTAGIDERPAEEMELECWGTFEENALAKARYFFARGGGGPVVADDSGLEVFALGGRPGVRSKRWSGRPDLSGSALDEANNAKLLAELELVERASGEGETDRKARYVCVAAYVDASGERVFRGEAAGRILREPRGSEGFGYDPLFEIDGLKVTFAELNRAEKERVSHRGRAFTRLVANLRGES